MYIKNTNASFNKTSKFSLYDYIYQITTPVIFFHLKENKDTLLALYDHRSKELYWIIPGIPSNSINDLKQHTLLPLNDPEYIYYLSLVAQMKELKETHFDTHPDTIQFGTLTRQKIDIKEKINGAEHAHIQRIKELEQKIQQLEQQIKEQPKEEPRVELQEQPQEPKEEPQVELQEQNNKIQELLASKQQLERDLTECQMNSSIKMDDLIKKHTEELNDIGDKMDQLMKIKDETLEMKENLENQLKGAEELVDKNQMLQRQLDNCNSILIDCNKQKTEINSVKSQAECELEYIEYYKRYSKYLDLYSKSRVFLERYYSKEYTEIDRILGDIETEPDCNKKLKFLEVLGKYNYFFDDLNNIILGKVSVYLKIRDTVSLELVNLNSICVSCNNNKRCYKFKHIFSNETEPKLLEELLKKVNRIPDQNSLFCLFTYGYSGSGKTTLINKFKDYIQEKERVLAFEIYPDTILTNIKTITSKVRVFQDTNGWVRSQFGVERYTTGKEELRKEYGTIKRTPLNKSSSRSYLVEVYQVNGKHILFIDFPGRETPEELYTYFFGENRRISLPTLFSMGKKAASKYIEEYKLKNLDYTPEEIYDLLIDSVYINETLNHILYYIKKRTETGNRAIPIHLNTSNEYNTDNFYISPNKLNKLHVDTLFRFMDKFNSYINFIATLHDTKICSDNIRMLENIKELGN
jgi:hypothetical protein